MTLYVHSIESTPTTFTTESHSTASTHTKPELSSTIRAVSYSLPCTISCAGGATICPITCKLTVDLLTLKVVSKSRVTWGTCVPILVFLGLSVLGLFPMYATDRQTAGSIIA